MLGFLVGGDGLSNAFETFDAALLQQLVGIPSLLAAELVNVVGRVGNTFLSLSPGGDALVDGVVVVLAAAFGEVWFVVEYLDGYGCRQRSAGWRGSR